MKYFSILLFLVTLSQAYELDKQTECLAMNIYYEARNSNLADQLAVADVVLNRVDSPKYPNTVCEVVYQAKVSKWHLSEGRIVPLKNQCQFSWYCDGKPDIPLNQDAWEDAKLVAVKIHKFTLFRGISEGSLFYFAHYIDEPYWAKDLYFVGRIGLHMYYRTYK